MLNQSKSWKDLQAHSDGELADVDIADLNNAPDRFEALSFEFDKLLVDFSKQKITPQTINLLLSLANEAGLDDAIKGLSRGDKVNSTEQRAALHTALRLQPADQLMVDGEDLNQAVQAQLEAMSQMIDKLALGQWKGYSGKPITDVVNLGVGGSDLGPQLVCRALDEFKKDALKTNGQPDPDKQLVNVHFASTMDGSQLVSLFEILNPETTLFVFVSKSFSTIDTSANAATALAWLGQSCDDQALLKKQQFIGVSTSSAGMSEWGIAPQHQLQLWDWVGGRFSLWSTVGFTIAVKIGMDNFKQLLKGANALDNHFFSTDLSQNIPVLMGLIAVWNTNFMNIGAQAILPYDGRMEYFADYLMQLEMESNGKSVTRKGERIDYASCPILWGEVGPNAQHSFYQLLHQGTRKAACDFLAPIKRTLKPDTGSRLDAALDYQHQLTLANYFAQSRALMAGGSSAGADQSADDLLTKHKFYPGNQPSTSILFDALSPYSLGQLIALYEHKVFVMATLWGINPFDQWGVQLGKIMADETLATLNADAKVEQYDASTNGLMNYIKQRN